MPAALPPQQLQKLDDHHGAEGKSHNGAHHPNGQGSHGEQRFQCGNQQHQSQQQSADGKGTQQGTVVPEVPSQQHRMLGFAAKAVEQSAQAQGGEGHAIKRRTVANEVADAGRILINGKIAKASQAVKAGDVIEVTFGNRPIKVRVLSDVEPRTKDVAREMYEIISE